MAVIRGNWQRHDAEEHRCIHTPLMRKTLHISLTANRRLCWMSKIELYGENILLFLLPLGNQNNHEPLFCSCFYMYVRGSRTEFFQTCVFKYWTWSSLYWLALNISRGSCHVSRLGIPKLLQMIARSRILNRSQTGPVPLDSERKPGRCVYRNISDNLVKLQWLLDLPPLAVVNLWALAVLAAILQLW